MLARLTRVLLAAAFVLAQQSAFAHQLWHSAAGGFKAGPAAEQGKKSNPLCEQHDALGTVLGALSGASFVAPAVGAPPVRFRSADAGAVRAAALSPVSRGPPALL